MIGKTLLISMSLGLVLATGCDSSDDDGGDGDGGTEGGTPGVPAPYAGQTNPNEGMAAIDAGETVYTSLCATCHGATGAGDGAAGAASDPLPTNFQTTSQPDDFMLWTISEGVPMTTMVAYKSTLSEDDIWNVTAYIRTLQ